MREVGREAMKERKRSKLTLDSILALARKEVPGVSSWAGHVTAVLGRVLPTEWVQGPRHIHQ